MENVICSKTMGYRGICPQSYLALGFSKVGLTHLSLINIKGGILTCHNLKQIKIFYPQSFEQRPIIWRVSRKRNRINKPVAYAARYTSNHMKQLTNVTACIACYISNKFLYSISLCTNSPDKGPLFEMLRIENF